MTADPLYGSWYKAKASEGREYDLVLMDYQMPGWNGFETSRKIRIELENIKQPRIIMITGCGREEVLHQAEELQLDGFIIKPVSPSMLFDSIMEAFGKTEAGAVGSKESAETRPEGFDRIRGARLLLAEDNEINQQVARETLEQEGFYVDIVNNGSEAVERCSSEYDCVLMDLQMPVMDGYQATEKIRRKKKLAEVPIIAMTADAMVGVRERVLDSGMNDYVTKPFDPSELWAVLVRWIPPGDRCLRRDLETGVCLDDDEENCGCIPGIDVQQGLERVGGNRRLYRKLLGKFVEDFSLAPSQIQAHLDSGDRRDAERIAHSIKGAAGNLGACELHKAASRLNDHLRKDGFHTKHKDFIFFSGLLQTLVSDINSKLSETEDEFREEGAGETLSPGEIVKRLEPLRADLKKRKPRQCLAVLEELKGSTIPEEMKPAFEGLILQLEKYQFKAALLLLDELSSYGEEKDIHFA